jgi:hypothetical protein
MVLHSEEFSSSKFTTTIVEHYDVLKKYIQMIIAIKYYYLQCRTTSTKILMVSV